MTPSDYSGVENRKRHRARLGVPVECSTIQRTIQGRAENISASGLLIRADSTFSSDEEFALSFSLPGHEGKIECTARVAHVVPGIFMGIEFLDLSYKTVHLIEDFVTKSSS